MRISFGKVDLDSKPFESSKNQTSSTSSYQHRGCDTPQNFFRLFHFLKKCKEIGAGEIDTNDVSKLCISFHICSSFAANQQTDYFLIYDHGKVTGFIFALKTISKYFFQDFVLKIFKNDNIHSQFIMIVLSFLLK